MRKKETRTNTRNKDTRADFRGNAGKTDGKKKELRTDGRKSDTKTDFSKRDTRTDGRKSEAKTDFRKKDVRTDGRKSEANVDTRKKGTRIANRKSDTKLDSRRGSTGPELKKNREKISEIRETPKKPNLPENFEELKKSLNRASNWRERLDAIDKLGTWKSKEAIELLKSRLRVDTVYRVQEAAYDQLVAWGEEAILPERKTGELVKDTNKILLRIKKSLPEDHTFEDFKEKVKKTRTDLYDTYEGNKGKNFSKWLKETWTSLVVR